MFFLELSCFFDDPADVGNLISGSYAFSKMSLNVWKFMVHVLLKPGLANFKHYFAGEGNGKPLQYSCLENPMNSMKRQNDRILKEELPRSVGAQYATGDQWRNNSRKNEGMETKQKQYPVVDVTGDRSSKDPVKSNTAQEPGMSGPRINANWKCSNRRWQG